MYPQNVKELVWDFFGEFAKFEYALKQTEEFYRPQRNSNFIEADWFLFVDSFSSDILDTLITENPEVAILLDEPPNVEVVEDGHKRWVPMSIMNDASDMKKLIRSIKQVRNNLFHGGKFSNSFPDGGSRNEQLVRASLAALRFLKRQDSTVLRIYDDLPVEL